MMVKVFEQQCQVEGDRVRVREKTGGNIVCNPSDPDATLDGHKGSGYQVQLSETCSPDNATQLILSALPETACQSDSAALKDVVEDLKERGVLPSQMLADTAYGSDENHCHCRDEGIDLISPTAGKCPENQIDPQMLTAVDFRVEMGTNIRANGLVETCPQCVACPAGTIPHRSHYDRDTGQITVLQLPETCRACSLDARCPRKRESAFYAVAINPKQVRLIERRRHEQTDDFKDKYRVRSGIESTNSLLKRGTGLGRLRVRGRKAVFMSILLKVAGWNVMRAAKAMGKAAKSALSRRIVSSIQPRPTILRSNSKFLAI
jgi:hypothetical protein